MGIQFKTIILKNRVAFRLEGNHLSFSTKNIKPIHPLKRIWSFSDVVLITLFWTGVLCCYQDRNTMGIGQRVVVNRRATDRKESRLTSISHTTNWVIVQVSSDPGFKPNARHSWSPCVIKHTDFCADYFNSIELGHTPQNWKIPLFYGNGIGFNSTRGLNYYLTAELYIHSQTNHISNCLCMTFI